MMVARLGTMGYAMEALKGTMSHARVARLGTLGFAVFGALWAR